MLSMVQIKYTSLHTFKLNNNTDNKDSEDIFITFLNQVFVAGSHTMNLGLLLECTINI